MTLSAKNSFILGENKAGFRRDGHLIIAELPTTGRFLYIEKVSKNLLFLKIHTETIMAGMGHS